jgi:ABC-2 type transport system permease protein
MRSPTMLLVKDELIGFAKSKVMLVLWVVLPALALAGYFLLPRVIKQSAGANMSAVAFMGFIESSIAGTIAALMVAVDIVSEKNRKVYELYVIRPIPRSAIVLSKFIAVFACVVVACIVSFLLGIVVDAVRGHMLDAAAAYDVLKTLISLTGVVALSAAVGVFFGVTSRTILVAVLLILYVGQNLVIVPMLPMYLGILPNSYWLIMGVTVVLVTVVLWGSVALFRRQEF